MIDKIKPDNNKKLGILALISVVVGSMVGGGVYSLPQNTAENSAIGPVIIAWIISGLGMFFIANVYRLLSDARPDLQAGVYMYAQKGFGSFIGFNVAWGYWLMAATGNIAFAVIIMDAFNEFFPGVFTGGNNLTSIICGSILIWGYNFLVLSGVKTASLLNTIGTMAKLIPLVLFIIILGVLINYSQLFNNFWGTNPQVVTEVNNLKEPVSLLSQINSPMTITLFAFIGVEGAVVLSGRAKNSKDVGKATLIGFIIASILYVLLSVLPFGIMTQAQLSEVANPSTAGVLNYIVGDWGKSLMSIGLIISILAGWLAWTMLLAELPMVAAENGAFPRIFAKRNKKDSAQFSLWFSSFVMQAAMLLVYFSSNAWNTMYSISALMCIPAYFITMLFIVKICLNKKRDSSIEKIKYQGIIGGVLGAIFCVFVLYASEIEYVSLIPVLLTCGLPFFIWSRVEKKDGLPIFKKIEIIYLIILLLLDIIVLWLLFNGTIVL